MNSPWPGEPSFGGCAVLTDGSMLKLDVTAQSRRHGSGRVCELAVTNHGSAAVDVERLQLFEFSAGAEIEVFRQGFYMPSDPAGFHILSAGSVPPRSSAWRPDWLGEAQFYSHTLTVFQPLGTGRCRLLGFSSCRRFEGLFCFDCAGREILVSGWLNLEGLRLQPQARIPLEQVMFLEAPQFNDILATYVTHTAAENAARVPQRTTTGWVDWQYYREEKTEEDIRRNVDALKKLRQRGYPLEYVIVDGGWCNHASEWLEPCEKFRSGMKALGEYCRTAGLQLGLWLAPYLTNVETRVAREHPDWLVLDRDTGEPLRKPASNVGACHILDYTVPEALAWLESIVTVMVEDWGVRYLKLDGPALAHYRGGRFHNPAMTRIEQVRASLATIRTACGNKVIVEGEGLYGAAIGYVDTQRTTQDNHPCWVDPCSGKPTLKENMKNDLLSAFMHRGFWHNHRENVVLRDFPSPFCYRRLTNPDLSDLILPENELLLQLSAAALAGGAMLLSDPLDQLCRNPGHMTLISQFLPHYEGACYPVDVFRGGRTPSIYCLPVQREFESWFVLGIFNWDDVYRNFQVDIAACAGEGTWHAFDFWNEHYLGACHGTLKVPDVPAHGCRLIGLRADAPRPQLLGTNMHVLQGAVDLETVRFADHRLEITAKHFMQTERRIFVRHPEHFSLTDIRSDARDFLVDDRKPGFVTLQFNGNPGLTHFVLHWKNSVPPGPGQ